MESFTFSRLITVAVEIRGTENMKMTGIVRVIRSMMMITTTDFVTLEVNLIHTVEERAPGSEETNLGGLSRSEVPTAFDEKSFSCAALQLGPDRNYLFMQLCNYVNYL